MNSPKISWLLFISLSLILAGCGSTQQGPGEGTAPADCRVALPERLGTVTLQKGPDDCDVHYVFANPGSGRIRLLVDGALTVEAGTVIEFGARTLLDVSDLGSLQAIGTEQQPIVFKGQAATHGYWFGICFDNNRESNLDFVHVLYGGGIWGTGQAPVCEGGISGSVTAGEPVNIRNSVILGSNVSGMDAHTLNLGLFEGNVLADNKDFAVRVHASQAASLVAGNDFSGASLGLPNGDNRVFLWGMVADGLSSHTWSDLGVAWYVGPTSRSRYGDNVIVSDGSAVVIEAGARFEFGAGSSFNVWDDARIQVDGTTADPVVFDSVTPVPGSWDGLSFSRAGESVLENVEIRWAGDSDGLYVGQPAAVHIYLSSVTMTGSVIHGSGACAVSVADLNPGQYVDLEVEVQAHESGYPELCENVS